MEDNVDYGNLEYVVVNYNSQDELDEWIKDHLKNYLSDGILKYYKTTEPKAFYMSHAKNVAAKLATGDVICNIDADNFTGYGFARYVSSEFAKNKNLFLAVNQNTAPGDCFGRICMWKNDFTIVKGYDESMKGYGFEDIDLWNRLELLGNEPKFIENGEFLQAISHHDNERLSNEPNNMGIYEVYINYINHAISEFLLLFKNKEFRMGKNLIYRLQNSESLDNLFFDTKTFEYPNGLVNDTWIEGTWSDTVNGIKLTKRNGQVNEFTRIGKDLSISKDKDEPTIYKIANDFNKKSVVFFYSQINNRIRMQFNKDSKLISVNQNGYGEVSLIENQF